MSKTLLLKPRMSERAYAMAQNSQGYVFIVPKSATKLTIAKAVETQFEVTVRSVHTANIKGKQKRTLSLNGKRSGRTGVRSDAKKAYVTLAKGQHLPIYAAVEEAEEKEVETQKQVDKMVEKQAEKESKPARRGLRLLKKGGKS